MTLPHNLKSPVSDRHPEPVFVSDRNGQIYRMRDACWQYQFNASGLYNTRILVGPDEVDTPAPFLQTFKFGPEPQPLPNARPWHYAQQNQGGTAPLNSVSEILPDEQGQ